MSPKMADTKLNLKSTTSSHLIAPTMTSANEELDSGVISSSL